MSLDWMWVEVFSLKTAQLIVGGGVPTDMIVDGVFSEITDS